MTVGISLLGYCTTQRGKGSCKDPKPLPDNSILQGKRLVRCCLLDSGNLRDRFYNLDPMFVSRFRKYRPGKGLVVTNQQGSSDLEVIINSVNTPEDHNKLYQYTRRSYTNLHKPFKILIPAKGHYINKWSGYQWGIRRHAFHQLGLPRENRLYSRNQHDSPAWTRSYWGRDNTVHQDN